VQGNFRLLHLQVVQRPEEVISTSEKRMAFTAGILQVALSLCGVIGTASNIFSVYEQPLLFCWVVLPPRCVRAGRFQVPQHPEEISFTTVGIADKWDIGMEFARDGGSMSTWMRHRDGAIRGPRKRVTWLRWNDD
jgi:hypothetical protein